MTKPEPQYPSPPTPPLPEAKRKRRKWPWIVGAVVVLIVIAAAANGGGKSNTTRTAQTPPAAPATGTKQAAVPAAVAPVATTTTAAPTTAAKPTVFTGRGDDVLKVPGPDGLKIVRFQCPQCTGNTVLQTDGAESLLVNTIGAYSGEQWADVTDGSNTTTLTVKAQGSWTITVGGIDMAQTATGTVSGTGDDVVVLNANTTQAAITNHGQGNFVIQDVSASGGSRNLDVNEIGSYSGTVPLAGPALIQITSDGSWSINPS
jgi:hypothetical protein